MREKIDTDFNGNLQHLKLCSDRVKSSVKAKNFFDVCRLFFDLFLLLFPILLGVNMPPVCDSVLIDWRSL